MPVGGDIADKHREKRRRTKESVYPDTNEADLSLVVTCGQTELSSIRTHFLQPAEPKNYLHEQVLGEIQKLQREIVSHDDTYQSALRSTDQKSDLLDQKIGLTRKDWEAETRKQQEASERRKKYLAEASKQKTNSSFITGLFKQLQGCRHLDDLGASLLEPFPSAIEKTQQKLDEAKRCADEEEKVVKQLQRRVDDLAKKIKRWKEQKTTTEASVQSRKQAYDRRRSELAAQLSKTQAKLEKYAVPNQTYVTRNRRPQYCADSADLNSGLLDVARRAHQNSGNSRMSTVYNSMPDPNNTCSERAPIPARLQLEMTALSAGRQGMPAAVPPSLTHTAADTQIPPIAQAPGCRYLQQNHFSGTINSSSIPNAYNDMPCNPVQPPGTLLSISSLLSADGTMVPDSVEPFAMLAGEDAVNPLSGLIWPRPTRGGALRSPDETVMMSGIPSEDAEYPFHWGMIWDESAGADAPVSVARVTWSSLDHIE